MENKRSREDIVANILEVTSLPVNQTMIMYRANMSFSQLREYMRLLQRQQLIEKKGGKWVTTTRGREYLKAYAELQRIMEVQPKTVSARHHFTADLEKDVLPATSMVDMLKEQQST